MLLLGQSIAFWGTVFGAALLKIFLTPFEGFGRSIITFGIAIFFASIFTDPVISYLNLDPVNYKIGAAAVIALTGEGIARRILNIISDQKIFNNFFSMFKGGKD